MKAYLIKLLWPLFLIRIQELERSFAYMYVCRFYIYIYLIFTFKFIFVKKGLAAQIKPL